MTDKFIDVEQLIGSKNPRLLRWSPNFIINYIKRILHQEEVNSIIYNNRNDTPYEFCVSMIDHFNITIELEGLDNLPEKGGVVCIANHPFGGLEAIALMREVYPKRPDLKFIVN